MITKEQKPIFIAGADRSGTSLLFALLASHPDISMVRRTNMWRYFYGRFGDLSQHQNFEQCLSRMMRYKRLQHLDPDYDRIRDEFLAGEPSYGRLFALFHLHNAERKGKSRWGDKSLHTEHYADQIFGEFPQAKIIHMIRDPRDRYASVAKRYDTTRGGRVGSAAARWLYSTRNAEGNLSRYPGSYMVVKYETLAQYPEETLGKICAFLGEEYTVAMLTMDGNLNHKRAGNSSFGELPPGVISTRSINRFRKVLDQEDYWFIQICLGKAMKAYDYRLESVHLSPRQRLRFYLLDFPVNLARMGRWIAREAIMVNRGENIPEHRLIAANAI